MVCIKVASPGQGADGFDNELVMIELALFAAAEFGVWPIFLTLIHGPATILIRSVSP